MSNLSLIIPTYRNPAYLDICLESFVSQKVLLQTEIIVVIDGFHDESRAVLEKYGESVILVLVNETNQGMQASLNTGVMQASNDLICIINDDNIGAIKWDERILEEWNSYVL